MSSKFKKKDATKIESVAAKSILTIIFKDFAFIILPLIVLIISKIFFGESKDIPSLFSSSNFSFVVVVLLSVTLSGFIELKVQHQKDLTNRLFYGTKMITFALILSVVVLVYSILRENTRYHLQIDQEAILGANILLFLFGLLFLSLSVILVERDLYNSVTFKEPKRVKTIIRYLDNSISLACRYVNYSDFVLGHFSRIEKDNDFFGEDTKISLLNLEAKIKELEGLLTSLKNNFDDKKHLLE